MKRDSIKKNFFYQATYQILILALPLITSPYVSRIIGAEGLGIYSYSYSVAYYFVLVSMLGILNYGNRAIAKVRDNQNALNREFSSIALLHIGLAVMSLIIYIIYACLVARDSLYAFIQIAYVLSGLFDITWFYFGIEKFKLTVMRNVTIKILTVLCVFLFVREADDTWKYCLIYAVSMLFSQIILWIPLKRYAQYVRPSRREICRHLKPMLILFIPTIAISLYKYMDKIMIGLISTKEQLGYYENSECIVKVATMITGSLGTVMLPQMSNLIAVKNMEKYYKYINYSMRYILILAYAMAFGLAGVASVFAPIFWGEKFRKCGVLIQILASTVPFVSFANIIRTQFLLPKERDLEYMRSVIIGAIVNLLFNLLLIGRCGALGAAIATVFAEVSVCVIQIFEVRKELQVKKYIWNSVPFLLIGILMFCVVYFLGISFKHTIWTLFIQITSGAIIYIVLTAMLLWVQKDELLLASYRKIIKRRNYRK